MSEKTGLPRRSFLKRTAGALGAVTHLASWAAVAQPSDNVQPGEPAPQKTRPPEAMTYPRVFRGQHLQMISFPLGGVAAGSLGLGGRGQLRDWEIFNRPNQGFSPPYAFPAIWVQSGSGKPITRVLESRILPPYQGQDGLGSNNVPGLARLQSATFTGDYPLAHIDFEDSSLPVKIELDAFSPFIPHDPDNSGLPATLLRYTVKNDSSQSVKVSIAFSVENPIHLKSSNDYARPPEDTRQNAYRESSHLQGLLMSNPGIPHVDPMAGTFAIGALPVSGMHISRWRGWPKGRWWNSPMLFWDAFSAEGALDIEPDPHNAVGALCQGSTIPAKSSARFTFVLAWHFANRTPDWCGWDAPAGKGGTVIGNHYATRFKDAWGAADYLASHLENLEKRTRTFVQAMRDSTIPAVVREAASANLSTLASTTCFRTADGEFHGFEGSDDTSGCCFGNCTHVWNYETATAFLFPTFARSLRKAAFGYSMDDQGGMRFRQLLPDGYARFGFAAADGQMGQIMHAYLDWKISGDDAWIRELWPKIRQAIAFAWEAGGWDPEKKGVLTGVQHNTYDVEFYGPNAMCSGWYLGALRACEEMARALGDAQSAVEYRKLFEEGSKWVDANLFNGKFYTQKIVGYPKDKIAANLQSDMGSEETEDPQYQVGQGCLIDQLVGQYMAEISGLGALLSAEHVRATLGSLYAFNYKRSLEDHSNVERTFALNDEAAMVICDYGNLPRPRIPFPYYAEVMTGFEHSAAALMIYSGMVAEGIECIGNIRSRYDGLKRNPWDEAECGHHYARAMSSWSSFVALSGFAYDALRSNLTVAPRVPHREFRCFWSTGTGWGRFEFSSTHDASRFSLTVLAGNLRLRSCELSVHGQVLRAQVQGETVASRTTAQSKLNLVQFDAPVTLEEGNELAIEVAP